MCDTRNAKPKTKQPMKTVSEHIDTLRAQFLALSDSRKNALRREARLFINRNPGCADHSTFWRGLSARHILATRNLKTIERPDTMTKKITASKNRFGFRVRVGERVGMVLPRGGSAYGTISKIEHEGVYGMRATLDCGFSGSIDDCYQLPAGPM